MIDLFGLFFSLSNKERKKLKFENIDHRLFSAYLRFEVLDKPGVLSNITKVFSKNSNDFYDDYAHHPTEISSVLDGVRNVNMERKIISVFEPHRYSRVMSLKNELSK